MIETFFNWSLKWSTGFILLMILCGSFASAQQEDYSALSFITDYGKVDVIILDGRGHPIAKLKPYGCLVEDTTSIPSGEDCHSSQAIDLMQIRGDVYQVKITAKTATRYSLTVTPQSSDGHGQNPLHFKGQLTQKQTEIKKFLFDPTPNSQARLIK